MPDEPSPAKPLPTPEFPGRGLDALRDAVVETERHVAGFGWDQPPRLFALVRTEDLLGREPGLAPHLTGFHPGTPQARHHLTAIEQDGLAPTSSVESILGTLAWPPDVDGAAIAVERLVVPPEAERNLPDDPEAAVEHLAGHADRQDVRLLVGVMRDGTAMCALRQRAHDDDASVALGPDLVPGLVHALLATFAD